MAAFWVFGYGSLMWNPGFAYQQAQPANAEGYHRSLCIYSHYCRGTAERPGLVMGLNPGGSCRGIAFYVKAENAAEAYRYLVGREQVGNTYVERNIPLHLADGREIEALAFTTNLEHQQYAGKLSPEQRAKIVACACGAKGCNRDYVVNTVMSLRKLGIHDAELEAVLAHLPAEGAAGAKA